MDSIVDAFFPLIDFIEGESNEVDTFLSDPFSMPSASLDPKVAPSGVGVVAGRRIYDENVVGIVIETADASDREKASLDSRDPSLRKATVKRSAVKFVLRGLSAIPLPNFFLRLFPASWTTSTTKTVQSTMLVDANGYEVYSLSGALSKKKDDYLTSSRLDRMNDPSFDRSTMLKRIADTRKLVTGLSRLLGPKSDVVRGLRKRTKEENLRMFRSGDSAHDISIYIGDLFGESSLSCTRNCVADPSAARRPYHCYAAVSQLLRRDPLARPPRLPWRSPPLAYQRKGWNRQGARQALHRDPNLSPYQYPHRYVYTLPFSRSYSSSPSRRPFLWQHPRPS